jgi:hypothetical protein
MAMKFDKETLLKHRFWIMLAVAVTLLLGGIVVLEFSEAGGRAELVKDLTAGKQQKAMESPKTIEERKKNADLAKDAEAVVWKKAYEPQAKLFRWPDKVETHYDFANGYFANDVKILKLGEAAPGKKGAAADPKALADATKNWPADTPNLMHGAFVQQEDDWFMIKNRKGETIKFFQTKRIANVLGEDGKSVAFTTMNQAAAKKMLAVGYQRGKYFGDPLTRFESELFKANYKQQIFAILESVDPYIDPLNGVVQLRGWNYKRDTDELDQQNQRFIRYVTKDWPEKGIPIDQEAWIAQEDLWIQTELYRIIRSANDTVSNFTLDPRGKNDDRNKKFRNSYFDLELKLDEKENLSFKITNALERKQSIDLHFKVRLNNAKGFKEEVIKISGLPLMPAGTPGDKDSFTQTIDKGKDERTGIYSVQQVLNWQTAAVKRIDQISIGSNDTGDISHSQRTFPVGLRPLDDKDLARGGDAGKGAPVAAGGKGKVRPPPPNKMKAPPKDDKRGPAIGGAAGGNKGQLPAVDLWTDRYVEVTEQARRLPVAVVLIVDQTHVDRVLTAFNNSNLRFLETQVLLNQYPGSLQPPVVTDDKAEPGAIAPPLFPGRFGPKGGKGLPGPMNPAPEGSGSSGADVETNMELVIYGIVTLYQRYPPRPPLPALDDKK